MSPNDTATADPVGAFIPGGRFHVAGASDGPLKGLTFAAKDIFDVAGRVTGCGNPDWARTHPPATRNASCVQALLDAGAELIGKTITDELAFSLMGENSHYGTPVNVAAPGRVPGGSSCGSAAAVAAKRCDLALGSDTGGSVRIPANNCGLYGIRTTHGRIALDGTMPLAPSFDVCGWFTRDARLLRRVGTVLLGAAPGAAPDSPPSGLLVGVDAFGESDAVVAPALAAALARAEAAIGSRRDAAVAPGGLGAWYEAFRVLQGAEVWRVHGDWVTRNQPRFGPGVADRFRWVATIDAGQVAAAEDVRRGVRRRMHELLRDGAVLSIPTAPSIAPLRGLPAADSERFRVRTLMLTCIAGLAGLPQVTLPLGRIDGCPIGLSLIAAPGRDEMLLALAERIGS
ncbi:MAG: amidase [Alphaproteobacteria bacterium]|nr:amidase [Alphaproteobacteria bacterium]